MKLVCPICKGRMHQVYTRVGDAATRQYVGLGNYYLCDTDDMIYVPTGGPIDTIPQAHRPKGAKALRELEDRLRARRLVPESD